MSQEQPYHLGVKAIIQNTAGQVLLLKHVKGYWDFPGGRVNVGETVLETLLREVHEETGLTGLEGVQPDAMVLTSARIPSVDSAFFGLVLWFHTCLLGVEMPVVLSEEHTEFAWVDAVHARGMVSVQDSVAPHVLG